MLRNAKTTGFSARDCGPEFDGVLDAARGFTSSAVPSTSSSSKRTRSSCERGVWIISWLERMGHFPMML